MFHLPPQHRYIINSFVDNAKGKVDKVPVHPLTLKKHSAHDPDIWMDYETASDIAQTLGEGYGVGYVFTEEDKYFFIDLDNCLLPSGEWSPFATQTCNQFTGVYVEVSHSGRGLHIIGRYEGEMPAHSCKNLELGMELYTSGRFCAITETGAQGDANVIKTQELLEFIATSSPVKSANPSVPNNWTSEPIAGCEPPESNEEVIRIIRAMPKNATEVFQGKQHASFDDLFDNNEEVLAQYYPSQSGDTYDRSSADSALAYRLHYFLGGNCERVNEIMRMSKLYRDKWDRLDYLPRTVLGAGGRQTKHFVYHRQGNYPAAIPQSQPNPANLNVRVIAKEHYPELSDSWKPLDTSRNLKFLLDTYGITVRWNDMKRIREVVMPNVRLFQDDPENDAYRQLRDLALLNGLPIVRIDENLETLAQKNNYHPIVEAVTNNPWDGIPRLDTFIRTLESSEPELAYKLIRRWMISAIAAAYTEGGFSAHGILVLVGAQSLGKTTWIKMLDPINCKAVREGAFLDPTSKDCLVTLASHWIIELGELDGTLRKADIARLKSHITSDMDIVRRPFTRKDSHFTRRTVYAASVNDSRFLIDVTGNRRFWTIPVTSINNNHNLNMLQVWAEVYALWKTEKQTWLSKDEEACLNVLNKDHEQIEPFEEKLLTYYDFSEGWEKREVVKMTASVVLNTLGYNNPSRSDATRMAYILRKQTGKDPYRRFHTIPKYTPPKHT